MLSFVSHRKTFCNYCVEDLFVYFRWHACAWTSWFEIVNISKKLFLLSFRSLIVPENFYNSTIAYLLPVSRKLRFVSFTVLLYLKSSQFSRVFTIHSFIPIYHLSFGGPEVQTTRTTDNVIGLLATPSEVPPSTLSKVRHIFMMSITPVMLTYRRPGVYNLQSAAIFCADRDHTWFR